MRLTVKMLGLLCVAGALWAQQDAVTVSHNATFGLQAGDTLQVIMQGPAGGVASFQIEGQPRTVPMDETQPGRYAGDYVVRRNDSVNNKLVVGTLKLKDGRVLRGEAPNRVGMSPPPPPPVVADTNEYAVRALRVSPDSWVKAGGAFNIVLDASPGCRATLSAGGLFLDLPLTEREPGRYTGNWTVPDQRGITINQPTVLIRLTRNNRSVLFLSTQSMNVDSLAPVILGVAPANGDIFPNTPFIAQVAFDESGGSQLNGEKCVFTVDGTNLSNTARYQDGMVLVRVPALPAGRHRFGVTLVDQAGNAAPTVNHEFTTAAVVVAPTVTHTAAGRMQPGDAFTVKLTAPAKGRATFSIGTAVTDQPMAETKPGEYTGEYVVRRNDNLAGLPVIVNYTDADGKRQQYRATAAVGGEPTRQPTNAALVAPTFTSPANNATVEAQAPIRGTATPGAKVEITIESVSRVAGFMEMKGDPIKLIAAVNNEGQWATAPVNFAKPALAGKTTYTISAVTVVGDKRSTVTSIKVER